jgi:N-acetylglutamate synthase-like GNAT family acetyltransferase
VKVSLVQLESYAIREASPEDAPALESLLAACGLSSHGVLASGTRYWLAEDAAGAPLGAIGLELGAGAALLRSAAVLPEHRGAGVGAALVGAALAAAAAHGPLLYLFSTGAGLYWQRFGFVEAPVDELVAALPGAPQVRHYDELGWLPDEIAWVLRVQGAGDGAQSAAAESG